MIRTETFLALLATLLVAAHLQFFPVGEESFIPRHANDLTLRMSAVAHGEPIRMNVFLPANGEVQTVVSESIASGGLDFEDVQESGNRMGIWSSPDPDGQIEIAYQATVSGQEVSYNIDDATLERPTTETASYLQATDQIQVRHPEIAATWVSISPETRRVKPILESIFKFVRDELEPAEFKGVTDALTALRLRQASCNGKSRLFAAMARLSGLPTRLVGGVILNTGIKKTSHQWVEVRIGDHWVPFDPTNDHFARLPWNYLVLYRGDYWLFKHSPSINFDYSFQIASASVHPIEIEMAREGEATNSVFEFLLRLGFDADTTALLLLFPFAALIVSFFRNVIGFSSFGIFLPVLLAAVFQYTGLWVGILGFVIVLTSSATLYQMFARERLLHVPKLAAMITIVTAVVVLSATLGSTVLDSSLTSMVAFPIIILSITAEKLHELIETGSWGDLLACTFGTLAMSIGCHFVFESALLAAVFLNFPELLVVVLALQLAVGRWVGLRVSELWRFRRLLRLGGPSVLGLNERNLELVESLNPPELIAIANDKIDTKQVLEQGGVPTPETIGTGQSYDELQQLTIRVDHLDSFVVKPATGSRGHGILVVVGRMDEKFRLASGELLSHADLVNHMRQITNGGFTTRGTADRVLVERLIQPSAFYQRLYPDGIADVRVVTVRNTPVAAMLRVPARDSRGKANLHQGGIGIGIDLATGRTASAAIRGRALQQHPDTGMDLLGLQLPEWDSILEIALAANVCIPLGYAGVDICVDKIRGPMVLEINARPGLEIQNVNMLGLRDVTYGVLT